MKFMDNTCKKLTIGMVVYDDWDGFYFSIQAIRMYHKEVLDDVEFVIINTNPSSPQGQEVAKFCKAGWVKEPLRHFCDDNERGTATRSKIFDYAKTPYVLVIDSHVMIEAGGIKKLIDYFDNVDDGDLIQAPLLYDHLQDGPSCFKPEWRAGMYGTWEMDERSKGDEPFEIVGNGLGLFACKKDSWLGFHPKHVGFGGEELVYHEKVRQVGKKTVCLPSLKWLHRFARPNGVPYKATWEGRIKNYFRGFTELRKPVLEVKEHFLSIGISESDINKWLLEVNSENDV
jgi:hypothetical protein